MYLRVSAAACLPESVTAAGTQSKRRQLTLLVKGGHNFFSFLELTWKDLSDELSRTNSLVSHAIALRYEAD